MGAAYAAPDILTDTYVPDRGGCVAKLEYHITAWSAFWMKLQSANLSSFRTLSFYIKADPAVGIPAKMKIELKRAGNSEVAINYISGITNEWQRFDTKLSHFGPALSSWTQMEELVFTFEATQSGQNGIVYLDDIVLY